MQGDRVASSAFWCCLLALVAASISPIAHSFSLIPGYPYPPVPPPPAPGPPGSCPAPGSGSCIPDACIDDTLYNTHCCSGVAVPGSTVCANPADYGTTWATCTQTCGTGAGAPVGTPGGTSACIKAGEWDDTLYNTDCCSGVAVPGSTTCSNPADYGTTWATCQQLCAGLDIQCVIPSCNAAPIGCHYGPMSFDTYGCPACGPILNDSDNQPCTSPSPAPSASPAPPPPTSPPPPPSVPAPPICMTEAGEIRYTVKWNDGTPGSNELHPPIEGAVPFLPEKVFRARYPWQ